MERVVEMIRRIKPTLCVGVAMLMLLGSACLPEPLDVDTVPVVKPEIVVSTQMIPDQTLLVLLTRTFGALDATENSNPEALLNQIAVNDAEVTITGPDGSYSLTSLGYGAYGGVFIPFEEGESYDLKVVSQSMGEVTSTTKVNAPVRFEEISATFHVNAFEDSLADISHSFKDPKGENYYMITSMEIEDRSELIRDLLDPDAQLRLLKDDNFDGQIYSETFRVVRREFSPGDSILVSLANISPEYYRFMELRLDNRFSFVEYLSEPINYPSNINGGRGYFNLYVPDIRLLVLEQPDN